MKFSQFSTLNTSVLLHWLYDTAITLIIKQLFIDSKIKDGFSYTIINFADTSLCLIIQFIVFNDQRYCGVIQLMYTKCTEIFIIPQYQRKRPTQEFRIFQLYVALARLLILHLHSVRIVRSGVIFFPTSLQSIIGRHILQRL